MNTQKLVQLQMRLECIGVKGKDLMVRVKGPYPDDISHCSIVKTDREYKLYINFKLSKSIQDSLREIKPKLAFNKPELIKNILGRLYPKNGPKKYISYIFPEIINSADSQAILLQPKHQKLFKEFEPKSSFPRHPAFGIIVDNKLVTVCESSREDDKSAEAWVRTLKPYRGRGYAKQTTFAWANNLIKQNKIPFYSHEASNTKSAQVAKGLGLILSFEQIQF